MRTRWFSFHNFSGTVCDNGNLLFPEPMSVDLHVDGINDPCTKGKDINFVFKGFTLSGQVKAYIKFFFL